MTINYICNIGTQNSITLRVYFTLIKGLGIIVMRPFMIYQNNLEVFLEGVI